jgi:hypothetical protein
MTTNEALAWADSLPNHIFNATYDRKTNEAITQLATDMRRLRATQARGETNVEVNDDESL